MAMEPMPWTGQMPTCPICLSPVQAMSVVYDNVHQTMLYYVRCHGRENTLSLTQEEILKTPLLQTIEEKLKIIWRGGWITSVATVGYSYSLPPLYKEQVVHDRLKAAADRTLLERPKRKIKFED